MKFEFVHNGIKTAEDVADLHHRLFSASHYFPVEHKKEVDTILEDIYSLTCKMREV